MKTFGPPGHDDWPALATTAAQLRDRAEPHAAERRIFASLAALWRAVVDRADLPVMKATRPEIRDALAAAIARARAGGADLVHIARLEALLWYHMPVQGSALDVPHIVQVHKFNQTARAERAARPVSPRTEGGRHGLIEENAPVNDGAGNVRRPPRQPAPQQAGLF